MKIAQKMATPESENKPNKTFDVTDANFQTLSPSDRAVLIAKFVVDGYTILQNGVKVKNLDSAAGCEKGRVLSIINSQKKKLKEKSRVKKTSPDLRSEASASKQSTSGHSVKSELDGTDSEYRPASPFDAEEVQLATAKTVLEEEKEEPKPATAEGLLERFLGNDTVTYWCPKPAMSAPYQMHIVGGSLPQVGLDSVPVTCDHDWEVCDCKGCTLLVLSVHAFSEEKLADLIVKRGEAFVVARYFGSTGCLSGHSGDVDWHVSAPNQVVATFIRGQVREAQTLFSHSWLFNGGKIVLKDRVLQSRLIMQDEKNGLGVFKIACIAGRQREKKTVRWDAVSDDYDGIDVAVPRGVTEYAARGGVVELKLGKVNAYGGFYFLFGEEEVAVVLSRTLVNVVASKLIGKPREHLLLQAAVSEARSAFAKVKNLPEDIKARTIVVTAAFALAELVPFENAVYATEIDRHAKDFEVHAKLVTELKPIYNLNNVIRWVGWVVGGFTFGVGGTLLVIGAYTKYHGFHFPKPRTAMLDIADIAESRFQEGAIVFAASPAREPEHPLLGLKLEVLGKLMALFSGVSVAAKTYLAFWWGEQKSLPGIDGTAPLPSGILCPVIEQVGENKYGRAEDAYIEETGDEKYRPMNPRLVVYGIVLNGSIPYCFKSASRLVEYSMLTDRLCIDTPEVNPVALCIADMLFRKEAPIYDMLRKKVKRDVEKWLAHFPTAAKKRLMEDAMLSLIARPINNLDLIAKIFVKIEKSGFLLEDGPEFVVPRPIVSRTPRFMCVVGPFFYGLGELMKECLHTESGMYYAASTAEDAGRAFDYAIRTLKDRGHDIAFMKSDFSRLDAHEVVVHLEVEHDFFESLGMEGDELWVDEQYHVVAYTYGGYKVIVSCRCTGDPKTSVANTLNNLRVLNYVTSDAKLVEDKFLLAGGDDGVTVIASHLIPVDPVATCLDLGYRVKLEVVHEICEVEFYSRLFWPTPDGSVLGAKIGRWLMKASSMLITQDGLADYRSAIIGHLQDNYHVPFVREYCQRVLEILPVSNSRYVEYEPHKVHTERAHEYCDETFVFLFQRYGLTRSDLVEWERLLKTITSLPAVLYASWMNVVFDKDL